MIEEKDINHIIEGHSETEEKKDHYHGIHHITASGTHDDVTDEDFSIKRAYQFRNRRELIFKIAASGVFLALALIFTWLDSLLEDSLEALFGGIKVPIRILDFLVLVLASPVIGPLFGCIIAFLLPWIHGMIIDPDHFWFQTMIDSFVYPVMIFIIWFFYYVVFKNSNYHKETNKHIDFLKRIFPQFFIIIIGTILFTLGTVISMWAMNGFQDSKAQDGSLNQFLDGKNWHLLVLLVAEFIRFSICSIAIFFIEPKTRIINHHFAY
ncbi:hypothetical protein [Spiroplasma endosymbiont of Crioceris asparagi]|uniref:hypothetical protein n=1 Tax=Spiroplasma endosymbiont of Crioceris asparagi TaxID=3066286 RepID=UPI0030CF349C